MRIGGWSYAGLVLPMLAGLLFAGCDEPSGRAIKPADLYGVWAGETIGGRALFSFQMEEQVNRFALRAAPGEFIDVLKDQGNDLLSLGGWYVIGSTINLVDEDAAVYACPASDGDPYDVILNQDKSIMLLDYLGQECPVRGQMLTGANWIKQEEAAVPVFTPWR